MPLLIFGPRPSGKAVECGSGIGMPEIIEGEWDDWVAHHDLRGRRVRVIVLEGERLENPWLNSLRAWADRHKPLTHPVNDSREGIYLGTLERLMCCWSQGSDRSPRRQNPFRRFRPAP